MLEFVKGVLVPALFAYAADQFGDEFFTEAWEEFFLWDSVPDNVAESPLRTRGDTRLLAEIRRPSQEWTRDSWSQQRRTPRRAARRALK